MKEAICNEAKVILNKLVRGLIDNRFGEFRHSLVRYLIVATLFSNCRNTKIRKRSWDREDCTRLKWLILLSRFFEMVQRTSLNIVNRVLPDPLANRTWSLILYIVVHF